MELLGIAAMRENLELLKKQMSDLDFWQDRENAVAVSKQAESDEKEINQWDNLTSEIDDILAMTEMAEKENDGSMNTELEAKLKELEKIYDSLEFKIMFSGKYDKNNAILSLHAGTGGVDAQDWAQILERMFLRFAEKMGWQTEVLDRNVGNEAGIKSSSIKISGRWAYGYLKSENGVHRLVRISPFDAEAMRHTSFALAEVIPEITDSSEIEIKEEDIRIDVYRSSGPGGQSVNTTDSAVRIVHKPTGITVACQNERSQHQNKENALKILRSKLIKLEEEKKEAEELKLRGEAQKAEWGKQIRSYVMQPYQLVKDHRTEHETSDIDSVLDGDLGGFIEAYLRWLKK